MHISRQSRKAVNTSSVQGLANRGGFRRLILALVMASGVAPALGASLGAGGPPALLGPAAASEVARFNQSAHVPEAALVREQPVSVNLNSLNPSTGTPPSQITVNLFGTQSVTLVLDRIEVRSAGNYTWQGKVQGYPKGRATLTVVNGQVAGIIDLGDVGRGRNAYQYHIQSRADGLRVLRQIDQSGYPPDHPPGGDPVPPVTAKRASGDAASALESASTFTDAKADSGSTIDVLVFYSNQTAAAAGSGIGAQIQQAVDTANTVYANSGITTRLRLVGYLPANYDETGDYPTDLTWLSNNSSIASQRNSYGADLVSMFVESSQYCGYGWIGPSTTSVFTVVNRGCSSGNYSFAHEIGHNFGARHDVYADSNSTPYAYGHGYVDCTEGWRDVMAYPSQCGGTRVPYFSNPNMTYGSPPDPLGTTSTANVVKVHNDNAYTVANYRASVGTTTGTCTYGFSPGSATVGAAATSGSFSVTTGTGCAWNSAATVSWLTITSGASASGTGTLGYSVDANSGPARNGSISVGGQLFTVSQAAGCTYALSPSSASTAAAGGSGSTSLTTSSGCSWSVSSSASWLTVMSATSGTGSATVSYSVAVNTGAARSGNLSVGGTTFVVSQDAGSTTASTSAASAALSPTSLSFGNQPLGTTSATKTATLTNTGAGSLTITSLTQSGSASGDFALGGTCAVNSALAGGQSCTLTYTFTPTAIGSRTATLSVGTTANGMSLSLSGSGKKPGRNKLETL